MKQSHAGGYTLTIPTYIYANLLNYLMIPSRQLRRQSTMQRRKAAPLSESDRALSTMALSVSIISARRLPKTYGRQPEGTCVHGGKPPRQHDAGDYDLDRVMTGRREDGRDRGTGMILTLRGVQNLILCGITTRAPRPQRGGGRREDSPPIVTAPPPTARHKAATSTLRNYPRGFRAIWTMRHSILPVI